MANPTLRRAPRWRDQISLYSEVAPDGRYGIVLARGDTQRWLTYEQVLLHCTATIRAAVYAEHDAAVFKQLTGTLELPLTHAGETVNDLRKRRPPVDAQALQPLGLEPSVTVKGKPFLVVKVAGHTVGQWSPADARQHAMACLELAAAVTLDNNYFDFMTDGDGAIPENAARNMVGDLTQHIGTHKVVKA